MVMAWTDRRPVAGAWSDNQERKVFAQRVDSGLNPLWSAGGVLVKQNGSTDPAGNFFYMPVWADNVSAFASGGAMVFWTGDSLINDFFVGYTVLDGTGERTSGRTIGWSGGSPVSSVIDVEQNAFIASRNKVGYETSGHLAWSKSYPESHGMMVVPDSDGMSALVAWTANGEVRCQRLSGNGTEQWTPGGVVVKTLGATSSVQLATDHSGGAWVVWSDNRSGKQGVYYQHLDETGAPLVVQNGVALRPAPEDQVGARLVSFADGHAIVAWNAAETGVWAKIIDPAAVSVAISSFTATVRDGSAQLRAAFRSDLGVERLNVYRAAGDASLSLLETATLSGANEFEYTDDDVMPGTTYRYQIGVVDGDGEFLSAVQTVTIERAVLGLDQNHPNPFNPSTVIGYTLAERAQTTMTIFDAEGRRVRTLVDDAVQGPGRAEAVWNGRDDNDSPVASGVYFYRLTSGKQSMTRKMVLLK
jgi:hypothetical protein